MKSSRCGTRFDKGLSGSNLDYQAFWGTMFDGRVPVAWNLNGKLPGDCKHGWGSQRIGQEFDSGRDLQSEIQHAEIEL